MEELHGIELTYKEFLYRLRKAELEPYIIVGENCSPFLGRFVRQILKLRLEDGQCIKYYSIIKQITTSFLQYFTRSMLSIANTCEMYCNKLDKADLEVLLEDAIDKHAQNQRYFLDKFAPISPREQGMYDEVVTLHGLNMSQLSNIRNYVASCKRQTKVDDFVRDHFKNVVAQCSYKQFFETHLFLSMMIAERASKLRACLRDISIRIDKNLEEYLQHHEDKLTHLHNELYDMNKEELMMMRLDRLDSASAFSTYDYNGHINKAIECTRQKIATTGNVYSLNYLKEESKYWHKRLDDLDEITDIIKNLEEELQNTVSDEKKLAEMKRCRADWNIAVCTHVLDLNYEERKTFIKKKIVETAQCYMTFCSVRGINNVNYADKLGQYTVDEYNHRNYIHQKHLVLLHVDCEGEFIQFPETIPYYFDEAGRYIIKNGKKVYQIATCTSEYELGSDDLLKKITKDCGHSEHWRPECRMDFTYDDLEILPSTKPVDIRESLNANSVKYLWDVLGWILPEVLCKVGEARSKNPIHMLAHELMRMKYKLTKCEIDKKTNEAAKYRDSIYNEKIQKTQESPCIKHIPRMKRDDKTEIAGNDYIKLLRQAQ